MAKYSIEDTTLRGIADAIRSKTGGTDDIVVANMATTIASLSNLQGSELKIKRGNFSVNTNSTNKITIKHDLGCIPKVVCIYPRHGGLALTAGNVEKTLFMVYADGYYVSYHTTYDSNYSWYRLSINERTMNYDITAIEPSISRGGLCQANESTVVFKSDDYPLTVSDYNYLVIG